MSLPKQKSDWGDLVRAYFNGLDMFSTPVIYATTAREIEPLLDAKTKSDLAKLIRDIEHDMRGLKERLEVIRAMHTNNIGGAYQGPIHTDNADFKYIEISAHYASWNEEFQAILSQSMVDIKNILDYVNQNPGVKQ